MKKFVFTLQSVYDYKKTIEKKQKEDLQVAQRKLKDLQDQKDALEMRRQQNVNALDDLLEHGGNLLEELPKFDAFFRFIRDQQKVLDQKILVAEQEKNRVMNLLIQTMREIKTYSKLKDEQLARYKVELAQYEEKEIGDIVSFKATFPSELEGG